MNLYTCTDHDFYWPSGVASVILAKNEKDAIALLDEELIWRGLKPYKDEPYTLRKIPQTEPVAIILRDGNY